MVCDWCIRHASDDNRKRNPTWTQTPCVTYRLESVKRHERGDVHKSAAGAQREVASIVDRGGIEAALQDRPISINKMALIAALRAMYWLLKSEVAHTTNFAPLLQLAQSLGCQYIEHLNVSGNANYTSKQVMGEFVQQLGEAVMQRKLDVILRSRVYGIMVDESTDVSNTKQLVLYVRYLVPESGRVETSFLSLREIKDGRALTVFEEMKNVLDHFGIPLDKLAGFGSDGASVMVGRDNGVAALLKKEVPSLISIHCVAHRLALGVAQAATHFKPVQTCKRLLQQLYGFYSVGPVRAAGLREIQRILNGHDLKLVAAKDVRWHSHTDAVTTLKRTLGAVIASLEREATERGDATAQGLVTMIKRFSFTSCVAMLCDVLPVTNTLSKLFQRVDIDFTTVGPHVAATQYNLQKLKGGRTGSNMLGLEEWLTSLADSGVEPYSEAKFDDFVSRTHDPFIERLGMNLEGRFEDTSVLTAFRDLLPCDEPEVDTTDESDLQNLCRHFRLDVTEAAAELRHMRSIAKEQYRDLPLAQLLWKYATTYADAAPLLSHMAASALVVPVSTADCERGFSAMNRLKTTHRNRMVNRTLESLLWVVLEGGEYAEMGAEFFDAVAEEWAVLKNRRLTFTT